MSRGERGGPHRGWWFLPLEGQQEQQGPRRGTAGRWAGLLSYCGRTDGAERPQSHGSPQTV